MLFREQEKLLVLPGKKTIILLQEEIRCIHITCTIHKRNTFVERQASEVPLPPNPVTGIPFKEDITDNKIGSIRCVTASSGFEWTHAQQSSPTSAIAPGRIFVLTNLEIFFKACKWYKEKLIPASFSKYYNIKSIELNICTQEIIPDYTVMSKVSQAGFQACNSSTDHDQPEKFLMLQMNVGLHSCSTRNQFFLFL